MKVLVTGSAGFIGNFVAEQLLARGDRVVGLDSLTPYYDVALKEARLARIGGHPGFTEARIDLADGDAVAALFAAHRFERVVHLAAQAGVRHSLDHPRAYAESNLAGFLNILEGCRAASVAHLVFASSSSVYGGNTKLPYATHDAVNHPISLYAATKRANELMAHSYAHLFRIPCTGLRFFTVYGPWGRPDMAYFKFTKAILEGRPIDVYNRGEMRRDFTYIDDVVDGVVRVLDRAPEPAADFDTDNPDPAASASAPFRLFNIGNNRSEDLLRFISVLEEKLGREAEKNLLPMQPGDVPATWADVDDLVADFDYSPSTPIEEGLARFVDWYRSYYRV